MPGKIHSHGYLVIYSLPADSIAPHSGFGGWMPNPIKLRDAATVIEFAILLATATKIGDSALGRIYLKIIRPSFALLEYADSIYY